MDACNTASALTHKNVATLNCPMLRRPRSGVRLVHWRYHKRASGKTLELRILLAGEKSREHGDTDLNSLLQLKYGFDGFFGSIYEIAMEHLALST